MVTVMNTSLRKKTVEPQALEVGLVIEENPEYPLIKSIRCERSQKVAGDYLIRVSFYKEVNKWHISTIGKGTIIFVKEEWFNHSNKLEITEVGKTNAGNTFGRGQILK
jgi:hypothetical protein